MSDVRVNPGAHTMLSDVMQPLTVGLAPGIDPGRVRLMRQTAPPAYEHVVASLAPADALALGRSLVVTAEGMV